MKTRIRFLFGNMGDSVSQIYTEIPEGTTVEGLADLCVGTEGVTLTKETLLSGYCALGGRPVTKDYLFTGKETSIDYFDVAGSGCSS